MRVPQVSERIKEVPAQALRGVFAGIGQLLLITDRLRNKTPADAGVPREKATEPAPAQPAAAKASSANAAPAKPEEAKAAAAKAAAAKPARAAEVPKTPQTPRIRDFDKTGNVRLLHPEPSATPVSPATAAAAAGSESGDSGPPLPNYDELSVASLRARLRNLDVARVRQLAEYERAHAARADVITMFERRIVKLEADA
jgi:hypothetical protein